MPFKPQPNLQSSYCGEILPKINKIDESSLVSEDSCKYNENTDIIEGKWEQNENLMFIVFLDFHSKIFSSKEKRKSEKIFKILSNYLGNRTAAQCRSHYQKLMIKFKTVPKLKRYFKAYFGEEIYTKKAKEFQDNWKQVHITESPVGSEKELRQTTQTGVQTQPIIEFSPTYQQQMFALWQFQQQWSNQPFYWEGQQFWNQSAWQSQKE